MTEEIAVISNIRATSIIVNKQCTLAQKILECVRNVTVDIRTDITPDFILNPYTCAIYSTISYHSMHSTIIQRKIKEIGRDFRVRVCLLYVDMPDCEQALLELNKICFSNDFTLIVAWSPLEAARYLETFKYYEAKPSTSIQERVETGFVPTITSVLSSVRSINKTDISHLMTNFDNFSGVCNAEEHHLILCPGIGEKKAKRLHQILHQPLHAKKNGRISSTEITE